MALTGPPAELWVTPPPRREPGTLAALWGALAQSAADLWRAVSLLLLFAPAALTAFPALQYGVGRGAWMTLLRCAMREGWWCLLCSPCLPCLPGSAARPGPRRLVGAAAVRAPRPGHNLTIRTCQVCHRRLSQPRRHGVHYRVVAKSVLCGGPGMALSYSVVLKYILLACKAQVASLAQDGARA